MTNLLVLRSFTSLRSHYRVQVQGVVRADSQPFGSPSKYSVVYIIPRPGRQCKDPLLGRLAVPVHGEKRTGQVI